MQTPSRKYIVMMGTDPATKGGVASVIQVYQAAGLFQRFPVRYLATHCDAGAVGKLMRMGKAYLQLLGMLLRGQVGLLHVHVASRASFWRKYGLFLMAMARGVPTVLHLHGAEFAIFYGQECGALRRWLVRTLFDKVSRVVVLSSAWKQWVQTISSNPHIEAIYNPVMQTPQPTPWRQRRSDALLFMGRLGVRKGAYDLLEASASLVRRQVPLQLQMGGDGELAQVQARADTLGIAAQVELLGWVGQEARQRYLSTSTVYVLPSYNEGLPMSVLEAMAAGMPIVSTPVGGIPEAVSDGVEGFLVPAGDVEALADRLALLLSDPELAQRMGDAAWNKVRTTFSSDAVLPKVEQMYRDLGCGAV